jgi:hypothetical protein
MKEEKINLYYTEIKGEKIHKECKAKMITLVLPHRWEDLTYCPNCVSKKELKSLTNKQ